jgi:predicted NAD/FAD-binding protein
MARIAVIGTGIAGLSAAYFLDSRHEVTVYEKETRLGGHSRTVTVDYDGRSIPVDTGFIVFNRRNYPNLTTLFRMLGVAVKDSDMSFGFSTGGGSLEWGAKSLNAVFGQRRNLLRPNFLKLFLDVMRFNSTVENEVERAPGLTLGELLAKMKMGEAFRWNYLLPMAGAIWSCPPKQMLEFPARVFVRFFANHNLLSVRGQPQWMTVEGGARAYVERLAAPFADRVRTGCAVKKVTRGRGGVTIEDSQGGCERYDEVVFACHPDEALAALCDASDAEDKALRAIAYQRNVAVLHRDTSFMPKRQACWASWVYQSDRQGDTAEHSVTYWMNSLSGIEERYPMFVTLNPYRPIAPEHVFDEHVFMHPVFDFAALKAQEALKSTQGQRNTWFCGAYLGHGFHEDGLVSAMHVADALGCPAPWSAVDTAAAQRAGAGYPRPRLVPRIEGGVPAAFG